MTILYLDVGSLKSWVKNSEAIKVDSDPIRLVSSIDEDTDS